MVAKTAEESMNLAVREIKDLPDYSNNGEVCLICIHRNVTLSLVWSYLQWVMTDARHDSMANAYHTTVPCISGR